MRPDPCFGLSLILPLACVASIRLTVLSCRAWLWGSLGFLWFRFRLLILALTFGRCSRAGLRKDCCAHHCKVATPVPNLVSFILTLQRSVSRWRPTACGQEQAALLLVCAKETLSVSKYDSQDMAAVSGIPYNLTSNDLRSVSIATAPQRKLHLLVSDKLLRTHHVRCRKHHRK